MENKQYKINFAIVTSSQTKMQLQIFKTSKQFKYMAH
jgi:hypothetical protein